MEQVITDQQASSIRTLQFVTIAWMVVELCVAVYSGVRSHSIALTAFGADSAIELLSAVVVLRRFTLGPATEKRAARISGFLLYGLAAYILVTSLLSFLSRSSEAHAAQSNICAYMSWIALAGLLVNRYFHLHWADPVAALLLLPIVLKEAGEASRGDVCECC